MRYKKSLALYQRGKMLIPGCSQTFSKGRTQWVFGASPLFLRSGSGCMVTDMDENEYIDYSMALGSILLGYGAPAVQQAVMDQMREGTIFSLPHPLEVEVAERLTEMIPCAEMARFGKNGSDATSGAVRLARAFTGRSVIATCGYHGWQDWSIAPTSRNLGVPGQVQRLTRTFKYNDVDSLREIFAECPGQVAAVILEPVSLEPPQEGFLEKVQELTKEQGALLIFDEVLTGFRLASGGAQAYFGVTPDLACFGKAMANGWPLSALVGKREVMQLLEEVFFSFTFGGEALSLAAAHATFLEIQARPVIPHLWKMGEQLQKGYNQLAHQAGMERFTECVGLPPRTAVLFRDESGKESLLLKSFFQQECVKRGLLFCGIHNLSYSHSEQIILRTLAVYQEVMTLLAEGVRAGEVSGKLDGEMLQPVFQLR